MSDPVFIRQSKRLLKRTSKLFGIEIHRIKAVAEDSLQELRVQSPVEHNSQANMATFYSDPKLVKRCLTSSQLQFFNDVIEILPKKGIDYNGKSIADAGCGTGHLLLSIRNRFNPSALTGMEYVDSAIEIALKTVPDAEFHLFDIYEGVEKQFDIVFCLEVLEHLLYPQRAFKNLLSMLNAHGTLLITVPDGRKDTFLGHINYWSPESWRVFVKSNCDGFDAETGPVGENADLFAIISRK